MRLIHQSTLLFLLLIFLSSCSPQVTEPALIDANATAETAALFQNLLSLSDEHILFGHQHATEYGSGWYGDRDRSDVKSVSGSHPAVIGMDIAGITKQDTVNNLMLGLKMQGLVKDTYQRGGVTTLSWHFTNPLSPLCGFYWLDSLSVPSVKYLIPNSEYPDAYPGAHETYKAILRDFASWARSTKGPDNEAIPMIFRPYHEFDGSWFWWGADHCTPEEFKSLWRFTVSYLRDTLEVHNLIYAFSPDKNFENMDEFLERYPGDQWVDMLGMDNYGDLGRDGYDTEAAAAKLKLVSDYAEKAGKLAAFTETGLESISDSTWWTSALLKTLQTYELKLSYVLVWRNDSHSPTHYYAPFPGHPSVPDFLEFRKDPYTLFEDDLPELYK